jgi:hypothetical protein
MSETHDAQAWRGRAAAQMVRLGALVRTVDDAGNVFRVAYGYLFSALPRQLWGDFDRLAALTGPAGWDRVEVLLVALKLLETVGEELRAVADRVSRNACEGNLEKVARFGAGLVLLGGWAQGIGARLAELEKTQRSAGEMATSTAESNEAAEDAA